MKVLQAHPDYLKLRCCFRAEREIITSHHGVTKYDGSPGLERKEPRREP